MSQSNVNVVLILTDNESAWTLGCYGNPDIRTPHLDQLASEGVRFDRAFAVNPVCSPNRATALTGLMPSQHGVHSYLGKEKPCSQMGDGAYCTIEPYASLPRMVHAAGRTCGLAGKWHLGDSLHPQLGFSHWFTMPRGHTMHFHDSDAIWQGEVYTEPRHFTDAITDHAVDFIQQNRERPFFLYVGYNAPYGLDKDARTGHQNQYTDYYADKPLACFPREPAHPWQTHHTDLINNETAIRSYAAAMSGMDDGVGRIMQTLADLNLDENTLVIFTADHGLCGGHHGFWGMGDHTRPMHMVHENMNIPLIFRHPGRIPAGRVDDTMVSHYDLLPTLAEYLNLPADAPPPAGMNDGHPRPGRSYAHALRGESDADREQIVFYEYETVRAVQTPQWKLILRHGDGPNELYAMDTDPHETQNLFDDAEHQAVRDELTRRLERFFSEYADPEYDVWNGGHSKAGELIESV